MCLRLFFLLNYYTEDQTRAWFHAPACCCIIQAPHEYNASLPAEESQVFKIDRDCLKGKLITSDCEGQQFCIWPSRHRSPQTASGSVWAQLGARGENIYQEFTFKCLPRFLILDPWSLILVLGNLQQSILFMAGVHCASLGCLIQKHDHRGRMWRYRWPWF